MRMMVKGMRPSHPSCCLRCKKKNIYIYGRNLAVMFGGKVVMRKGEFVDLERIGMSVSGYLT